MRKMEVFFDYSCPYCLDGHEKLKKLLPRFPDIEIIWRPCEAHPRPEEHGLHSDICIQGLLYVMETGGDIWAFHDNMYNAACVEKVNIEDPEVIVGHVTDLVEPARMLGVLQSGVLADAVLKANDYAYEENDVWVVPAFRMDGKKLDAVGGVGVAEDALEAFMEGPVKKA
ncbi:MAG: DsbA family protein [Oscillospiraceae bacterium]|nr:DsbA family protein [Oscillospiraceae bacterium]